jgi:hypothetical protein
MTALKYGCMLKKLLCILTWPIIHTVKTLDGGGNITFITAAVANTLVKLPR